MLGERTNKTSNCWNCSLVSVIEGWLIGGLLANAPEGPADDAMLLINWSIEGWSIGVPEGFSNLAASRIWKFLSRRSTAVKAIRYLRRHRAGILIIKGSVSGGKSSKKSNQIVACSISSSYNSINFFPKATERWQKTRSWKAFRINSKNLYARSVKSLLDGPLINNKKIL